MNTRLLDRAQLLLDATVQALTDESLNVPTRRYISDGSPALDCCNAIIVEPGPVLRGAPGESGGLLSPGVNQWAAEFRIWVTRETPVSQTGEVQSEVVLNAAGEDHLEEGAALLFGVARAWRAGDIGGTCTLVTLGMEPYGPEGGVRAWRLIVSVDL